MNPSVSGTASPKQLCVPVWQVGPWGTARISSRDDVEPVAAGFALRPEALPRAAVKGDASLGEALFVGFAVHVAEHQHLQGAVVLHDGGDQPVGLLADGEFLKGNGFDFHGVSRLCFSAWSSGVLFRYRRSAAWGGASGAEEGCLADGRFLFSGCYNLTGILRARSSRLSTGIGISP